MDVRGQLSVAGKRLEVMLASFVARRIAVGRRRMPPGGGEEARSRAIDVKYHAAVLVASLVSASAQHSATRKSSSPCIT